MLTLRKVAVTGCLGAGKTTVCQLLEKEGAFVISADKIVHELLSPKTKIGEEVIQLLGNKIVVDGQIDRSVVASIVFEDRLLLLELEKRLHPAVLERIEAAYQKMVEEQTAPLFIAEVPLLYEAGLEKAFDATLLVVASDALCKARFVGPSKEREKEFNRRTERLLSNEEKQKRAEFIIVNNGSWQELHSSVQTLYKQLTSP